MDPVFLVPICQGKYNDGSPAAAEEIAAWVGLEIESADEQMLRLRVADDEILWLPTGYWLLAVGEQPARIMDMMPDSMLRTRYAVHPGPVTVPTPPGGDETVTP